MDMESHRRRKLFTLLLPMTLSMGLGLFLGCKPDVCLDPNLSEENRCKSCKPRDDELLARLSPTQLPLPVRERITMCADRIHAGDKRGFVTKQALRECAGGDTSFDAETRQAVIEMINRSNLMELADLENYHGRCSAVGVGVGASPAPQPTAPPPAASDTAAPPATAPLRPAAPPSSTPPQPVDPLML